MTLSNYSGIPSANRQQRHQNIFNANNTTTYTDAGVVCSPSGNGNGVWLLTGNSVSLDGDVHVVSAFSCTGMTVTQSGPAVGELTTVTLVKQ